MSLPRWLWAPLLHGVILPLRSRRVARNYAEIWMPEGSPLAVYTRRLAAAVQQRMPHARVVHAMRYGAPSIARRLRRAASASASRRVVVLPLYPQYSTTTTASVDGHRAPRAQHARRASIEDYHRDPAWVQAIADSIRAHWAAHGRGDRLMFSFHGLPQRVVDAGDPVRGAVRSERRARSRGALGLHEGEYLLTYQSRFGRERWLEPATADALARPRARTASHASMSSARASPSIAWRRWKKSR